MSFPQALLAALSLVVGVVAFMILVAWTATLWFEVSRWSMRIANFVLWVLLVALIFWISGRPEVAS